MTALADWTLGDGEPPDVRIGVVLLADGATKLTLMVPEAPFDLVGEIVAVRSLRACVVDCEAADGGVRAAIDDRELGTASSWTLIPRQPSPGFYAPPVRVGCVPTGRWFHWETRTDQMLPGELTVRCVDGRLLLACDLPI